MSVTCTHEAPGVCPACADRAQRAGVERNHAEVWRMLEEMADSAFHDGKLPSDGEAGVLDESFAAWEIWAAARKWREYHEREAQRIEQGK